ncbi:hypothetical protein PG993_010679 [Apiospora rasikravindrae]|uniref:Uncharacterized protein n=1 Tax=Apiospora rasikravindrae TaxID=990691 RepID=A0ABR1SN02_9PEZI
MDSTPTRTIDSFYGSLNDNEKSALESMLRRDDEVLPTYTPEDSHMHFPPSATHTTEWSPTSNESPFDPNCWSNASSDFVDWSSEPFDFTGWPKNMETSPSSFIDSPFEFHGLPFYPNNWSIDFSDLNDSSSAHTVLGEASGDDVTQEAVLSSPCGEPSDSGLEMINCQEESNELGKRGRKKRRKPRSPAAPRKRVRSSKFNFSVEEVERQSQAYKRVPRRCGKPGQWKDFNGKVIDGKHFHTGESELSFKIRPSSGHMPVWMSWDKQEGQFRGEDIDGHTMAVDRGAMFTAVSEGPGSFVGDFIKD